MNVKQVIARKYLWTFFFFSLGKKWTFTLKIRCFVWQFVSSFMFYWFNGTQNLCPVRWFWYYAFCVGRFFCILLARHQVALVAKKGYRRKKKENLLYDLEKFMSVRVLSMVLWGTGFFLPLLLLLFCLSFYAYLIHSHTLLFIHVHLVACSPKIPAIRFHLAFAFQSNYCAKMEATQSKIGEANI